MVQIVQPLFEQEVARTFGGPQPGLAAIGEGSQVAAGPLTASIASQGVPGIAGGQIPLTEFGNIGAGGFGSGLATNPLFAAGTALLAGNNPLVAMQAQQQAQAQAQAAQTRLAIQLRQEQRAQAKVDREQAQRARVQGAMAQTFADVAESGQVDENGLTVLKFGLDAGDPATFVKSLEEIAGGDKFESVKDAGGNIVGQRNKKTGQVVTNPVAAFAETRRHNLATEANARAVRAATAAGKAKDGSKQKFDQEDDLRDEFNKQSQKYVVTRDSMGRIRQAANAQDTLGASDIALVFSFMKLVEPESSVREGEFATAENTGGVAQKVLNIYNNLRKGERLTPAQKQGFLTEAEGLFAVQQGFQDQLVEDYTGLAVRNNLSSENVVRDLGREIDREAQGFTTMNAADFPEGATVEDEQGNILVNRSGNWELQ